MQVTIHKAQTQVFSALGFLFQFQNAFLVDTEPKWKRETSGMWAGVNVDEQKTELLSAAYFRYQ
jgi:hypothetical protein